VPYLKNRLNVFTILYLPKRAIRFKRKATEYVHKYELETQEFKKRKDDFLILPDKEEKPAEEVLEKEEYKELQAPTNSETLTTDPDVEFENSKEEGN